MPKNDRFFQTNDGTKICYQLEDNGHNQWVVVTHGVGEHQGRHQYIKGLLSDCYNICTHDLRGHGKSGGRRHYIESFSIFCEDLAQLLEHLREEYKVENYVLYGHSMGSLVTSYYLQQYTEPSFYPMGVVMNAPPVGIPGLLGDLVKFLPVSGLSYFNKLGVGLKIPGLVDLKDLSHDPQVEIDYREDPLNGLKLHTKLALELIETVKRVYAKPLEVTCPAFVSVGSADRVVSPIDLQHYFSSVEDSFKITVIPDSYHEIHNEIDLYRKPYFNYLKESFQTILNNSLS